jgi:hypothetical protein
MKKISYKQNIIEQYGYIIEYFNISILIMDTISDEDIDELPPVEVVRNMVNEAVLMKISHDVFFTLKMDEYLGDEYTQKFFKLLQTANVTIFEFILEVETDEDVFPIREIDKIKELIDETYDREMMYVQSTKQVFVFSKKIKSIYYAGDKFINFDEEGAENYHDYEVDDDDDDHNENFQTHTLCESCKRTAFFPDLINEMEAVIGKKNCIYDMFSIGKDYFILFWMIKTDAYPEVMNNITHWMKYKELEDLMCFEIDNEYGKYTLCGNKKILDLLDEKSEK